MYDSKIVHTFIGKHHKYEIVQTTGPLGGRSYRIHRDGKYYRGSFDSMAKAVVAAEKEG